MDENQAFASFWGHIEELRRTLLRILMIIGASVFLCFLSYEPLITFLKKPLHNIESKTLLEEQLHYSRIHNSSPTTQTITLPKNSLLSNDLSTNIQALPENAYQIAPGGSLVYANISSTDQNLVVLGPLEGFLIALKTSLWTGAFLSSPLWLFVLFQFFIPGLRENEKRLVIPFILTSLAFVLIGCTFAFTVTIPIANHYLQSFNQTIGTNLWSLGNYLDYTLFLLMANGIAFELGAVGVFAVHLGIISSKGLSANRRFAILGAFIIATILTPPDVVTQLMLAIPLICLYEALILYAKLQKSKFHAIKQEPKL